MQLEYPYGDTVPQSGECIDICPQVKWLRTPLPYSLNHINCYLIKDGSGWAIVDTGMNSEVARDHWQKIIETQLDGDPVSRVIVTHQHPDHTGLAGWLCDTHKVPLYMAEIEYLYTQLFSNRDPSSDNWEVCQFFDRTGLSQEIRKNLFSENNFRDSVTAMPPSFHRIVDQRPIIIGDYSWIPITTRGHSHEHVSLYCQDLDLFISGDQVLPRITSNVSVHPLCADANPLTAWYKAHDKVAELIPDSVTVLPAHERVFKQLHQRLKDVIAHHEERLDRIISICSTPHSPQELTTKLFDRELDPFQNYMAVGEALAHLHMLLENGRIERTLENNLYLFKAV